MKIRGWVYIIINRSIPNLIKIGFSTKDPTLRAKELGGTGIPYDHEVIYDALVDNPRDVERLVHKELARFNEKKEWFNCSAEIGIESIKKNSSKIYFDSVAKSYLTNYQEANDIPEEKCNVCGGRGEIRLQQGFFQCYPHVKSVMAEVLFSFFIEK